MRARPRASAGSARGRSSLRPNAVLPGRGNAQHRVRVERRVVERDRLGADGLDDVALLEPRADGDRHGALGEREVDRLLARRALHAAEIAVVERWRRRRR